MEYSIDEFVVVFGEMTVSIAPAVKLCLPKRALQSNDGWQGGPIVELWNGECNSALPLWHDGNGWMACAARQLDEW